MADPWELRGLADGLRDHGFNSGADLVSQAADDIEQLRAGLVWAMHDIARDCVPAPHLAIYDDVTGSVERQGGSNDGQA